MSNLTLTLAFIILSSSLIAATHGLDFAVYWGQNGYEGDLDEACNTGKYKYVMIAFLYSFGDYREPRLDLASHCDPSIGGCDYLSSQITHCQSKNVKVFLSLGGAVGSYSISSTASAQDVADYLWNNYLGGTSPSRPLGNAVLDGIDFDLQYGIPNHYDDLARFLSEYSQPDKKVYLTAAPQCPYPDAILGKALDTGLFDYVWLQFYNNPPCEYSHGNVDNLIRSWKQWVASVTATKLFVGLPAGPDAAESGYIPPELVTFQVLPVVEKSDVFGGIMLWNRYSDKFNGYSDNILNNLINGRYYERGDPAYE